MPVVMSASELESARQALLGDGSDALINLMADLVLGWQPAEGIDETWQLARSLGWIEPQGSKLTLLGGLAADPIREYRFWLGRKGELHAEGRHPLLSRATYRDKVVIEVGSGFGCNLLSLATENGRFFGVEPTRLYRQMTPIFAEREGRPCPTVVDGDGCRLPFEDDFADIIVCVSSLQYMPIVPAIKEMTRVLRPGGQLQIIGATLGRFVRQGMQSMVEAKSLRGLRGHGLTVANTLAYQFTGRRLWIPEGAAATTAPVYPTTGALRGWLEDAGLEVDGDHSREVLGEMCFFATKCHSSAVSKGSDRPSVVRDLAPEAAAEQGRLATDPTPAKRVRTAG